MVSQSGPERVGVDALDVRDALGEHTAGVSDTPRTRTGSCRQMTTTTSLGRTCVCQFTL